MVARRGLLFFMVVALTLACGSNFSGTDSASDAASPGVGGSTGSGGSPGASGSTGAGGSSESAGSEIVADAGTAPPEGGVISQDAMIKPLPVGDAAEDRLSDIDASGTACKEDADCHGLSCLFDIKGGCSVVGVCMKGFDPTRPICNAISISCTCSGHNANVICNGLPGGYYSERIAHTGPC